MLSKSKAWGVAAVLSSIFVPSSSQLTGTSAQRDGNRYLCKCYPGDRCYPSSLEWNKLNTTVDGNLQVALPPGASCYNSVNGIPTSDPVKCAEALANYPLQQWTTDQPIASMWTFWTNETCIPSAASTGATCTRGFYGDYVILAKTRQHIKAGVDFARKNNIRVIIRNTGHDFMGRSTGFGSLVINTHGFKDVSFVQQYRGPGSYRGGAVTVGAGIQGRELYRLANAQNPPVVVVGGECPTVGFAGGYIQGGGHGPLSTFYGMAADHALSFEVLTPGGNFVTANEVENRDLFWALKGGGPSTFGVVLSLTVKTHAEVPTAGIILNINWTHTLDEDVFWKGVSAFHDLSNHWVDHGIFAYFELMPFRFHVQPIVGPNMTAAQLEEVAKPMFDRLKADNVPYEAVIKEFPTFYDLYIDMFEDEMSGSSVVTGGWIFPKEDFVANATGIVDAYRTITQDPAVFIIGHVVGPGTALPVVNNAIHPVWRNASTFIIISYTVSTTASWDEKRIAEDRVTNVIGKAVREAAPHGGAYVNEGDLQEPNWQRSYWGSNYPRLSLLKKLFDPLGVLYARTTPGTEDWEVIDYGTRLCKKL